MRLPKGHLRKRGNVYWCQWKHQGQPFARSLKTGNIDEAKRLKSEMMTRVRTAILDGIHERVFGKQASARPTIVDGDISLAVAWEYYLKSPNRPDTGGDTLKNYACQWRQFHRWMAEHYPRIKGVSEVNKQMARAFAAYIGDGRMASSTYNKYLNLLHLSFRIFWDDLDIPGNPWGNIPKKLLDPQGRRALTDKEIEAVLRVLRQREAGVETVRAKNGRLYSRKIPKSLQREASEYLTLFLVGFCTGMRLKDCCLLKWTDIDLGKEMILVVPSKTKRRTRKRIRLLILPELLGHLRSIKRGRSEYVVPGIAEKYMRDSPAVSDKVQMVFGQAGISTHRKGTGNGTGKRASVEVGFHSLRHTFVKRAKEAGVDRSTVQAIVGWGSPAMERHYAGVSDEHIEAQMRKLSPLSNGPKPEEKSGEGLSALSKTELKRRIKAMQDELARRKTR